MIKKLCITVLLSALMFNLTALAKENEKIARQEIADENLEILFNITTKNNNGPDKDFMDILQKYIFGEVFTIGDLDIKTRELMTVPANVKHWHGAAPDSWFSHLAVEVDGVETSNEWLEPVTDEEYNKLK